MKHISVFILICLILTLGYFIGLVKFITENEDDKCEMTYMFEYPQYVKISNKADKIFKKYGLYAYSEGRHTEKSRKMYFDGIPVLFIPGNKGSHKQVRSLSSVALRKWLNSRYPFHFDYFTVDLNEEYTGIYGPLLYDQLQYVNSSLYRILELYHDKKNPLKSVILIGHSMGGVIAMKLLSDLEDPNLVPILITLASPLKRAPVMTDYHLDAFYAGIFRRKFNATTIITVSGGYRDIVISPFLAHKRDNDLLHVSTSNIPISWTESNHVQILWCKQVVMALNRALFDSVDKKTNQISTNSTYRRLTFHHHLIHHSGIDIRQHENYFKPVQLSQKGRWIENLKKQYAVQHKNGLNEIQWYMVAVSEFAGYEKLSILAINIEVVDWVFACNAYFIKDNSRICHEGYHLTHKSEIVPSIKYKRRFFNVDLKNLKKEHPDISHIVFRALPTDDPLEYHVDVHGTDQRSVTVQLPNWYSLRSQTIIEKTAEKAIYYELTLPHLAHIIQYYKLFVEPVKCFKTEHHASITLAVPWSNENYHGFITNSMKKPFNVRLLNSKPSNGPNSSPVIKLILDSSCTYRISIQYSIFGSLGQLARTYTYLLLANISAIALMSLRHQLKSLEQGSCSILFVALQEGAKPYYVLTAYKIVSRLLSFSVLPPFIPKPDHLYVLEDGIDFFVLPLLLYLCSVGIFWILTIVLSISLVALESTVHKLCLKLLAKTVSFNIAWSDYFLSYLHKVPVVVALTLISLSISTCGGLALCLGAGFYFLKLTQMSQDFVEEVVWFFIKKIANRCKAYFKRPRNETGNQMEISSTSLDNNSKSSIRQGQRQIEASRDKLKHNKNKELQLEKPSYSGDIVQSNITSNKKDHNKKDLKEFGGGDEEEKECKKNGLEVNKENEVLKENEAHTIRKLKENKRHKVTDNSVNKVLDSSRPKECDENVETEEEDVSECSEDELQDRAEIEKKENLVPETIRIGNKSHNSRSQNSERGEGDTELSSSYNAIFFHSNIFFLWCIVTLINIPAVLTWAHNFRYSTALVPDDSFFPGFALSVCSLALWQFEFPKTDRKWMTEIENFVMAMAIVCLVFATISVYRLNYILTITIIVVTLHQLAGPKVEELNEDDNKPDYSKVKAKME